MKKNKILQLFLLITMFCIGPQFVSATIYNGEGSYNASGNTGGSCDSVPSNKACLYNSNRHRTVKVSLYYFDRQQNRTKLGHSVYLSSNIDGATVNMGYVPENIFEVDGLTFENSEGHFMSDAKFKDYINYMLSGVGMTINNLTSETVEACTMNGAEYGYRVIIEPTFNVRYQGAYSLKTIKEIASIGLTSGAMDRWDTQPSQGSGNLSIALYTNCTDVGISGIAPYGTPKDSVTKTRDESLISSAKSGYGYNIIDPGDRIPTKKCYKINTEINPATCSKPKDNIGIFKEILEEVDCDSTGITENATEYGRLISHFENNNSCKLYCLESAQQSYPGNASTYSVGRYLIWPTKEVEIINNNILYTHAYGNERYKMTIKGTKTCRFIVRGSDINELKSCANYISSKNAKSIYNFDTHVELDWRGTTTDGKGYGSKVNLGKTKTLTMDGKPNFDVNNASIDVLRNYLENTEIKVRFTDYFQLPDNYNRYQVKSDVGLKIQSTKPSDNLQFVDIGEGNLYIPSTASTTQSQPLNLKTIRIGENKEFSNVASSKEYSCKYNVHNNDVGLECPEDSPMYGKVSSKALMDYMVKNNKTKQEAIQEVCYNNIPDGCTCPSDSDMPGKSVLEYVGGDINKCRDTSIMNPIYNQHCYTCRCDEDDDNSNFDLTCIVKSNSATSGNSFESVCAEFKEQYCNSNITKEEDFDKCYYCPYPNESVDITACIAQGNSMVDCVKNYCYGGGNNPNYGCKSPMQASPEENRNAQNCVIASIQNGMDPNIAAEECDKKYCHTKNLNCPHDPNGTDPMSADFRSCVITKMNQGMSLDAAKQACNLFCTGGKIVIYRVISLENPFPSYDADSTTSQKGLENKPFNDQVRGRYPGVNWNSKEVVKNKILNNRGYDGSKIYKEAEPLYTFVLTTDKIKAIRNYNKKQSEGYNDFTLECKYNHSRACVSNIFVHNAIYGLTSGSCSGYIATASAFESCVTRRGE